MRTKSARQIMDEAVKEEDFQQQVIDYGHKLGWSAAHFRSVRVQRDDGTCYYITPVQADGKGFPDLVLVRERVVYAEVKAQKRRRSPDQVSWALILQKAGAEYYCWRPSDWNEIEEVLGNDRNTIFFRL